MQLDGVVEYKSLPSGLHNVDEDLVYYMPHLASTDSDAECTDARERRYFTHSSCAGLSAFVNRPASSLSRNASLVAVGVLVPLSDGRLGRSWRHAGKLRELARTLAEDTKQTGPLEQFWHATRLRDEDPDRPPASSEGAVGGLEADDDGERGRKARRSTDAATLKVLHSGLDSAHPARSICTMLHTFGPLIFPLYRQALLRKRILIVTAAPIHHICDFGKGTWVNVRAAIG